MNKQKFYVAYANNISSVLYDNFIKNVLSDYDVEILDLKNLKKFPNLIIFTGGEDVNPDYYNERKGKHTFCNKKRDEEEEKIFYNFSTTPKLGICRGAQLLTVLNGGQLIQHVENHTNCNHSISFFNEFKGLEIELPSTHHQMMYPYNLRKENYELIAYSTYFRSGVYLDGENKQKKLKNDFLEPEIVFYPSYNSLAIQAHPELISCDTTAFNTIKSLILNKIIKK